MIEFFRVNRSHLVFCLPHFFGIRYSKSGKPIALQVTTLFQRYIAQLMMYWTAKQKSSRYNDVSLRTCAISGRCSRALSGARVARPSRCSNTCEGTGTTVREGAVAGLDPAGPGGAGGGGGRGGRGGAAAAPAGPPPDTRDFGDIAIEYLAEIGRAHV